MNITGRVTADAQVRTVSEDSKVVNFSVAVNDSYRKKDGERVELTEYFDCSYWIATGIAEYLTKGMVVELSGRVSARAWKDSDGEAKAGLNFHTSQIKLHGGGSQGETAQTRGKTKKNKAKATVPAQEDHDDLPF